MRWGKGKSPPIHLFYVVVFVIMLLHCIIVLCDDEYVIVSFLRFWICALIYIKKREIFICKVYVCIFVYICAFICHNIKEKKYIYKYIY